MQSLEELKKQRDALDALILQRERLQSQGVDVTDWAYRVPRILKAVGRPLSAENMLETLLSEGWKLRVEGADQLTEEQRRARNVGSVDNILKTMCRIGIGVERLEENKPVTYLWRGVPEDLQDGGAVPSAPSGPLPAEPTRLRRPSFVTPRVAPPKARSARGRSAHPNGWWVRRRLGEQALLCLLPTLDSSATPAAVTRYVKDLLPPNERDKVTESMVVAWLYRERKDYKRLTLVNGAYRMCPDTYELYRRRTEARQLAQQAVLAAQAAAQAAQASASPPVAQSEAPGPSQSAQEPAPSVPSSPTAAAPTPTPIHYQPHAPPTPPPLVQSAHHVPLDHIARGPGDVMRRDAQVPPSWHGRTQKEALGQVVPMNKPHP